MLAALKLISTPGTGPGWPRHTDLAQCYLTFASYTFDEPHVTLVASHKMVDRVTSGEWSNTYHPSSCSGAIMSNIHHLITPLQYEDS